MRLAFGYHSVPIVDIRIVGDMILVCIGYLFIEQLLFLIRQL